MSTYPNRVGHRITGTGLGPYTLGAVLGPDDNLLGHYRALSDVPDIADEAQVVGVLMSLTADEWETALWQWDQGAGTITRVETRDSSTGSAVSFSAGTLLWLAAGDGEDAADFRQAVTDLAAHVAREDNPHAVTAAQAGADPAGSAAAVGDALVDHAGATDAHGATAAATASRIVLRDGAGRAQVADPAVDADVATRGSAQGQVDARVPDPSGQADGRILEVASGALAYADAAGGGGASGAPRLRLASSAYWFASGAGGAVEGVDVVALATFADVYQLEPMLVDVACELTDLLIRVGSASGAGGKARILIYREADAIEIALGELVYASPELAVDSTGDKTVTGLELALPPGRYYKGVLLSEQASLFRVDEGGALYGWGSASLHAFRRVVRAIQASLSYTAGAPPDPGPAVTSIEESSVASRVIEHRVLWRATDAT